MEVDRDANIKDIDGKVKNKFMWQWLEKRDDEGYFLSDYIRKINIAGKVKCIMCDSLINYGSSGCKRLLSHGNSEIHKKKRRIVKSNRT